MGVWADLLPAVLLAGTSASFLALSRWPSASIALWKNGPGAGQGSSVVDLAYCTALISAGPFSLADFSLPQQSGLQDGRMVLSTYQNGGFDRSGNASYVAGT